MTVNNVIKFNSFSLGLNEKYINIIFVTKHKSDKLLDQLGKTPTKII